ncbi:MAG TPA: hypothetical protein VGQ41_13735 [Pyrinomonadaceae bacterium]|nr:hypothetical protein [Pyrinomonadaceae bacterium]
MNNLQHSPGVCPSCGKSTDMASNYCEHCSANLIEVRRALEAQQKQQQVEENETSEAQSLKNRYRDAYRVARVTTGIGKTIKVAGAVLALIIFLGFMMLVLLGLAIQGGQSRIEEFQILVAIAALAIGGVLGFNVWLIFFIWGVLVSAQGQILKASLDAAVNGSPFLTNNQRTKIMSL